MTVVESLRDHLGRVLADIEVTPGSPPRADVGAVVGAPAGAIVDAVWSRLGGHRVSVIDRGDVADGLVARGATPARHLFLMDLDLRGPLPARRPGGVAIRPMDVARTSEYGALVSRAYPPGHPDHEPTDTDPAAAAHTVAGLLRGDHVGPWVAAASFDAHDVDGRVVGAILVSEMRPSHMFPGQPWITEIFVDPDHAGQGIGGALVGETVAALALGGRSSLGLAVTVGNPARRLYESIGFVITHEVRQVVLPA